MTDEPPDKGLTCRACGCNDVAVVGTSARFGRIYRRYECRACGKQWTAWEIDKGLVCPQCGCAQSEVDQTWKVTGAVRRARVCTNCGARWDTREIAGPGG